MKNKVAILLKQLRSRDITWKQAEVVTTGLKPPTTSHSLEKPDRCAQVGYMSVTRHSPSPERVWPARLIVFVFFSGFSGFFGGIHKAIGE